MGTTISLIAVTAFALVLGSAVTPWNTAGRCGGHWQRLPVEPGERPEGLARRSVGVLQPRVHLVRCLETEPGQRCGFQRLLRRPAVGQRRELGPDGALAGIVVNDTPTVGSVAWDAGGVGGTPAEGHVAWVANVEPNGTVDVEEYNYTYAGGYDVRTGLSRSYFSGFIHIHDITPSPSPRFPASSPNGFWLVGSDGGIFNFGRAAFYGSTGSLNLQRPVVGITPTATRSGYWQVASDGGVFAFGDAGYFGSIPGIGFGPADGVGARASNVPVVGMVPSTDGKGYFMVAADGGVFSFGDATIGLVPRPGRLFRRGRGCHARRHRARLLARHADRYRLRLR